MAEQPQIRFDDGAAYETYMGVWSRKVGEEFLSWLAPPPRLSWVDVGCGNGAFTALLAERAQAASILGVDPAPAQLAFAATRPGVAVARFEQGDAMTLPAPDSSADAAAMALVIVFVPEPARALAEMRRVVKPGGLVSAYMWDLPGGGFPFQPVYEAIEELGLPPPKPPSWDVSAIEALTGLWRDAGLRDVSSRTITVERSFPDFNTLWAVVQSGPRLAAVADAMTPELKEKLRAALKERLGAEEGKPITLSARANAVKGRVPD